MSSLGPLHRTHPKWHLGVWGVAPEPRPAPIPAPPARNDADAERPSLRVHGVARRAGDCLHRKLQKMAVRWWAGFTVICEFLKMGDLQVSMVNPILKLSNLALFGVPPWLRKPLCFFLGGEWEGASVHGAGMCREGWNDRPLICCTSPSATMSAVLSSDITNNKNMARPGLIHPIWLLSFLCGFLSGLFQSKPVGRG